ncbi:hypothetical protein Q7535_13065, partial [Glaesserella parasuis]|nr:hypothetical protein [Glaesserella parasuis]
YLGIPVGNAHNRTNINNITTINLLLFDENDSKRNSGINLTMVEIIFNKKLFSISSGTPLRKNKANRLLPRE